MRATLLILFFLFNMGFIWPFTRPTFIPKGQCVDNPDAKPLAIGYNEHYAFQKQDGSISYFIVDREYYKCTVKQSNSRHVSKNKWEKTLKEYRYEVTK